MSVRATVLFERPQTAIWSEIVQRLSRAEAAYIVSGFATPGGLKAIEQPIFDDPDKVKLIVVGAATYPGFEALDALHAVGVPLARLFVHLGHTRPSGTPKNPTARYHPMLHSKVYYMEFPDDEACAFIGSHNLTSFALTGMNGEASVLLEGPRNSREFAKIRRHIQEAKQQSTAYSPALKSAFAWWTREYLDGLKAEIRLPTEWITTRTILIFAEAARHNRPKMGQILYFELPVGIEQIETLKTEVHLFLVDTLPSGPWAALENTSHTTASFTCMVQGADNKQGNREIVADWVIQSATAPQLSTVTTGTFRPAPSQGMQQVRAEVMTPGVEPFHYAFERESLAWEPEYAGGGHGTATIENSSAMVRDRGPLEAGDYAATFDSEYTEDEEKAFIRADLPWGRDPDDRNAQRGWRLVTGLMPREAINREHDAPALEYVRPESGSFILVSLRRRRLR